MTDTIAKQSGVALIQAIVLAAVLSIIALFLNASAKNNVASAQLLSDRAQAYIKLYDAEAELSFNLLTRKLTNGEYENGKKWYFFGKPFSPQDGINIAIQDEAGLVPLSPLRQTLAERLIRELGYDTDTARTVVDSIVDWQDTDNQVSGRGAERASYNFGPRNRPMAERAEINWLPQIPSVLRQELIGFTTIFNSGYFNPVNAPEPVLKAYLQTPSLGAAVRDFRLGKSNSNSFSDVANIEQDEGVYFFTSPMLRINVQAKYGEAQVAKQSVIMRDPYAETNAAVLSTINTLWGQNALIVQDTEEQK